MPRYTSPAIWEPEASHMASDVKTVAGAERRIRPALMTTATTLLALLPVLSATGRGSDIMIPMAIPVFGGMVMATLTVFVVPVLFCAAQEAAWRRKTRS